MNPGRSHLINIILVCSLAINLLFVGIIIGRIISGGPPPRPMEFHFGWLMRDISPETRESLRPLLREHARTSRPLRRRMREAQRDFYKTIQEDPLDEEATRAALQDLREASSDYQTAMHEQMVDVITRLSGEDRRKALRHLMRHRPGDRRPGRDGGERRRPSP